jgi:hypothetical protein
MPTNPYPSVPYNGANGSHPPSSEAEVDLEGSGSEEEEIDELDSDIEASMKISEPPVEQRTPGTTQLAAEALETIIQADGVLKFGCLSS